MIGVLILAHAELRRTAQLVRHLARNDCRVAVHVDARVPAREMQPLAEAVAEAPNVLLVDRHRCEWGTFSLVAASLDGLRALVARWPDLSHVVQLSGACLPIRPIPDLAAHLAARPGTDFIESVPVARDPWVVDGLSLERFTLYHPFSWRRRKWLFDRSVDLQRRLRMRRTIPDGLEPRLGSQWWCLSMPTIRGILDDPQLPEAVRFFRLTWIPDESFFQTMAARHATRIEDRPLTFVRFDPQGKPHTFYDDHLELLLGADAFFARKIWRGAGGLYRTLLSDGLAQARAAAAQETGGAALVARFDRARKVHHRGRRGLVFHGRHDGRNPARRHEAAVPYVVFDGPERILPDLRAALAALPGVIAHGRLFGPGPAEFAGGQEVFTGNLSANPQIRDYHQPHFLQRLIWVERGCTQTMLHDLGSGAWVNTAMARDPCARILRLEDAWLLRAHAAWCAAPDALPQILETARLREARARALLAGSRTRAQVATVALGDLLAGRVGLAAAFGEHLPPALAGLSPIGAPQLPPRFADFLHAAGEAEAARPPARRANRAAAAEAVPKGTRAAEIAAAAEAVARFAAMDRAMRRKT